MIALLAAGICTPLGPHEVARAAIHAGLSRARQLDEGPLLGMGEDAHPPVGHQVLSSGEAATRHAGLLELAWAELAVEATPDLALLCTALGDPRRHPPDAATAIATPGSFRSRMLALGNAGPAAALAEAEQAIAAGARRVLVGAVETRLDPSSLAWLAHDGRLRGPETPDGLQPGEGAAWWLLGPAESHDALALVGARHHPGDGRLSPVVLAERLRALTAGTASAHWIDLTGEPWRARAWGTLLPHLPVRPEIAHPDHWGDLGAAAALCAATCAVQGGGTVWSLGEDGAVGLIEVQACGGATPAGSSRPSG